MSQISVGSGNSILLNYETLEEAINASNSGDIIIIKKNINISKNIKIEHDLTINGNDHYIYYDDERTIYIEHGNIDFNNLLISCGNKSNALNIINNDDVNLSLLNISITHRQLKPNLFYPSIFSRKIECNSTKKFNLNICNSSIDYIQADNIDKLTINEKSKLGNVATKYSFVYAKKINIENSQINNFGILSDNYSNTIIANNLSTIGKLGFSGNINLNNFSIDPLPNYRSNKEWSKIIKDFDNSNSVYALTIKSGKNENINVNIKNTNIVDNNLNKPLEVFSTTALFNFKKCNINFINSNIEPNFKLKSCISDSNIELNDSNINVNWYYENTDALLNDKECTLRYAINNSKSGDTIMLRKSITLNHGIDINHDLTIEGNGHNIIILNNTVGFFPNKGNITFNNLNVNLKEKSNFICKGKSGNTSITLNGVKINHIDLDPDNFYPSIIYSKLIDHKSIINLYFYNSNIDYIAFDVINDLVVSQNSTIGTVTKKTSRLSANSVLVNDSTLNDINIISRNDKTIDMNNVSTFGALIVKGNLTIDCFNVLPLPISENYNQYAKEIDKFNRYASVYSLITNSNGYQKANIEIKNTKLSSSLLMNQKDIYSVSSWFNFLNSNVKILNSSIGRSVSYKNDLNYSQLEFINSTDDSNWNNSEKIIYNNESDSEKKVNNINVFNKNKLSKSAINEINELIGLESVKNKLKKFISISTINKIREKNQHVKFNLTNMNMVFEGNPGTGKTIMARLFARALYEKGVIKSNKLVEVKAKDLVSGFIGKTATLTYDKVKEALDGVLFIDEAYALAQPKDGGNTFNNEAVDELISDIENNRDRLVVIMAGYKNNMDDFFKGGNPGLDSRFPNKIMFPDYNSQELLKIFDLQMKYMFKDIDGNYISQKCTPEARELVKKAIDKLYDADKIHDNARFIRDKVIGKIYEVSAERIASKLENIDDDLNISKDELNTFTEEDATIAMGHLLKSMNVNNNLKVDYNSNNIDSHKDEKAIDTLNSLIGLNSIKNEALRIIEIASINNFKKEHGMKNQPVTMNMVFEGNTGTGKTVVARLIAKALYENNVVKTNNFKEVNASDLIGQYVGQTAPKTKEIVISALNGVLFIDEAYQLAPKGDNDFNNEAVTELLTDIDNNRDSIVVIMAGYTKEMEKLFKNGNPGLSSRFPNRIIFPDYSSDDLFNILKYVINNKELICTKDALDILQIGIDEYFNNVSVSGNGRFIRNLVDRLIGYQSIRINSLLSEMRIIGELSDDQKKKISTINADDAKKTVKSIMSDLYNN